MFELSIAMRHINSRRRHTLFSLIAVALAVATIVVLMSMMSGVQEELIEITIENAPHIVVSSQSGAEDDLHLYNHLMYLILQKEGVVAVSPYLSGQAALKYKDNAEGVLLKGIEPHAEELVMRVGDDIVSGSFADLALTGHGIVLGDELADNLEVRVGDNIEAVYPGSSTRSFKVVGIINTGTASDESLAYARLGTLQDLFRKNGVVTSIGVRVLDPYQAEAIATLIEDETGVDAVSWTEANKDILDLLNTQMVFVWIFYGLIYVIAGFGIANTLITVVMDKKKEIGMLKAMGVSRKSITSIFLFESAFLGASGVVVGCVIGYLASVAIGSYELELPSEMYLGLTTMPVKIEAINFVYAAGFAFILNLIAGVYPARRASKLDPVEAIEND
ncbi:ABC transporter permease [Methanococcoides sp. AM1]|uniref:ABC transporter permease n=1 Tax=Methanococcoides sp. AM1 TaxID=1201011 RepID=UPI001082CCDB|nr:ABC transporter permease [Methanococcoides sp. AM1]